MRMTAARTQAVALTVVLFGLVPSPGSEEGRALTYDVKSVKRKLVLEIDGGTERLQVGDTAAAGQVLRTGWWSSAELAVSAFQSRFVLGSSTRVRLAGERPGVLIEVEKGRLHAIFDRMEGETPPERVVTTPSAVLAVRGTEYGVWVDTSGNTTIAVFKGEVEVLDRARQSDPIRVGPGFSCAIKRGDAPRAPFPHDLNPGKWKHGTMPGRPVTPAGGMGAGPGPSASQMGARGGSGSGQSGPK